MPPLFILAATFCLCFCPFLMVELFPAQLDTVIEKSSYLVFHNIAEFFSIVVSLSVFSVGWSTFDQSKDRRALFLGTAFLVVGLFDFMHTLSNAAMPAFITPNSTNKSTQFWITARLVDAAALLASAFVRPERRSPWISKQTVLAAAALLVGTVFTMVVFFPERIPATAAPGIGLTPLKRYLELAVIALLLAAALVYWRRFRKTGDRLLLYFLCAFVVAIFGEAVFASYKTGFDTYNVLGHIYKVVAFYLIYRATFGFAVRKPYLHLASANDELQRLNRLYTVLSETNKAIARAADPNEMFREICRVAVERGDFLFAWIGVLEENGSAVKTVALSGRLEERLQAIAIPAADGRAEIPTFAALRRGRLTVCNDILNDESYAPSRKEARKAGLRSASAIPLRCNSRVIGAMTVYAAEAGFFQEQLVGLLQQMEVDISFALDKFEEEARRREAERALQEEVKERFQMMESLHQKDKMLMQQSRMAAMGEMINNIAHQWRQPLNAVGLMVQELEMANEMEGLTKEYLKGRVRDVMNILFHMSQTIDDFRNFFRPEKEGKIFSLAGVVEKTVALIESSFKHQSIAIEFEAKDQPHVFGYPNEYSQVLLNILMNAKDAFQDRKVEEERVVKVVIFTEADRAVVTIGDNAGGISEDVIEKIFDPYFTTKGPDKGTGIGLYMSKMIIDKNMNGLLSVRNTDTGAEFRIELGTEYAVSPASA